MPNEENLTTNAKWWILSLVLPAMLLAGCPPAPTGPTAAELYSAITGGNAYDQWGQFPGAQGTIDSVVPHGPFANVFINAEVEGALGGFTGTLPDGSIIVKESFDANMDESGDSITVMWKVEGFDPDNNDWFWARFTFAGETVAEGKIPACAGCHGGARDNDFVFLQQF